MKKIIFTTFLALSMMMLSVGCSTSGTNAELTTKCGGDKDAKKCGTSKCGADKKIEVKKCGSENNGKCGSAK